MTIREAASIVHSLLVIGQDKLADILFRSFCELYGLDDDQLVIRFAELCDKGN